MQMDSGKIVILGKIVFTKIEHCQIVFALQLSTDWQIVFTTKWSLAICLLSTGHLPNIITYLPNLVF